MPKVRALTPQQATKTLANRFGPLADRLRQLATNLGIRPYQVFLVWSKWSGGERGEGNEVIIQRTQILPNPKVESLDNVAFSLFHAGTLPVGSIRLTRISIASFTQDTLMGHVLPVAHEDHVPEPWEFYYELVEDGRGDNPPLRAKYRLLNTPFRQAGKVHWTIMLERESEDNNRQGVPQIGLGTEG